ncbi:hypothetical protein DJ568_03630 [Mucilaginibacter hurinus]|uniref:Uncharacterized protein n=1 Tax=Mucilaginibacter hurinus TaxID=2201324 RepID=A0A367GQW8_9SPHI|nr:hypothetical protein DJ568_03630 [Mucilaginibacter hurinus]
MYNLKRGFFQGKEIILIRNPGCPTCGIVSYLVKNKIKISEYQHLQNIFKKRFAAISKKATFADPRRDVA